MPLTTIDEVRFERVRVLATIQQVVDYLFGVMYGLLAIRFSLALIGARRGNAFVRLIAGLTDPIYAPFKDIVDNVVIDRDQVLELSLVIAALVYMLLHLAIRALLRMLAYRRATF